MFEYDDLWLVCFSVCVICRLDVVNFRPKVYVDGFWCLRLGMLG